MKKLIAILLAAVVAVTLALPAFAAGARKPASTQKPAGARNTAARSRTGRAYGKAAGAKTAVAKNPTKTTKNNTLKVLAISDAHFLARELIKTTDDYHAQDVSKMQTPKGNDLFDLETGASCAYPVPIREVIFTRGSKTKTAQGSTIDHMPVTLVNPETGKTEHIQDISTYARKNDLSAEQIKGMCNNYISGYLTEHNLPYNGAVKSSLYKVINDVTGIPVSKDNHHILDLIVYARRAHQGGTDSKANIPAWFQEGAEQIKGGTLVYDALNILLRDVRNLPKDIVASALNSVIPAQDHDLVDRLLAAKPGEKQILDAKTTKEINSFLYDLLYSYVDDENYPDDREFNITLTDRGNGVMNDSRPVSSPADSTKKDEDLYKFVNTVINKIASGK